MVRLARCCRSGSRRYDWRHTAETDAAIPRPKVGFAPRFRCRNSVALCVRARFATRLFALPGLPSVSMVTNAHPAVAGAGSVPLKDDESSTHAGLLMSHRNDQAILQFSRSVSIRRCTAVTPRHVWLLYRYISETSRFSRGRDRGQRYREYHSRSRLALRVGGSGYIYASSSSRKLDGRRAGPGGR